MKGEKKEACPTIYVDVLREAEVIPQLNSSKPSEQSCLKSHTLSLVTHSSCDPHANIPSGQVSGGTVGTGMVTEGIVVFCLGSSPGMQIIVVF